MEKKKKKKKKWIIIGIVVLVVLVMLFGCNTDENTKLANEYGVEVALIEDLASSCEKIDIVFEEADIDELTSEAAALGYEDYLFDVTFANDKVTTIKSGTITFYDPANEVVVPIWDKLVSSDEAVFLSVQAQLLVEDGLKAPSTAEFPGAPYSEPDWRINKNGERYIVTSWVDAENSFGAMVRSNYTIVYDWNGDEESDPEVVSFIFDGEKIIE